MKPAKTMVPENPISSPTHGILLVDKPAGKTSFSLVAVLRRILKVQKIGHAGTLDPFATGVMVMLIGKEYTRQSNTFLDAGKEYLATIRLGIETDTYDNEGKVISQSALVPTDEEISKALAHFQGSILQTPPMFSAKKKNGKKLYELARSGITIERQPVAVEVQTTQISYAYPDLQVRVACSKGTYVRSIAHDLGAILGCGAHLSALRRVRSGSFSLDDCIDGKMLYSPECSLEHLKGALVTSCISSDPSTKRKAT